MQTQRKVSQTQIARDLGISQALVSLALNGRKNGINPETYQRIWDRAVELGYSPKGMQLDTAIAARRTRQVGYILRSPLRLYTQSNFFSHIQHGLHTALEVAGCTAAFLGTEDELVQEKLDRLMHPGDGLLGIVLLGEVKLSFLERVRKKNERIVAVSASFPGYCNSVTSNEQQTVELLVSHLVELGHRRMCWFGGNVGLGRHTQRKAAMKNALSTQGIEIPESCWIDQEDADRMDGARCVRRLLDSAGRSKLPTAIVCFNGMMARGAVNALHKEGLRVPEDISVVAIDRTRAITEENPTITGASALPEKMGETAAWLLLESSRSDIEGFTDLVLPALLFRGESSAPPRH